MCCVLVLHIYTTISQGFSVYICMFFFFFAKSIFVCLKDKELLFGIEAHLFMLIYLGNDKTFNLQFVNLICFLNFCDVYYLLINLRPFMLYVKGISYPSINVKNQEHLTHTNFLVKS